jgi:type II secretory pathway pseudopilin PulG
VATDMHEAMTDKHVDGGDTLVEVIVTVAVLGICVVGMLTGLSTAVASTSQSGKIAAANTVLRNYAETIERAAATCTPGGSLTLPQPSPAPTYSNPSYLLSPAPTSVITCPSLNTAPTSLTLSVVSSPDGKVSDSLTIWLYRP